MDENKDLHTCGLTWLTLPRRACNFVAIGTADDQRIFAKLDKTLNEEDLSPIMRWYRLSRRAQTSAETLVEWIFLPPPGAKVRLVPSNADDTIVKDRVHFYCAYIESHRETRTGIPWHLLMYHVHKKVMRDDALMERFQHGMEISPFLTRALMLGLAMHNKLEGTDMTAPTAASRGTFCDIMVVASELKDTDPYIPGTDIEKGWKTIATEEMHVDVFKRLGAEAYRDMYDRVPWNVSTLVCMNRLINRVENGIESRDILAKCIPASLLWNLEIDSRCLYIRHAVLVVDLVHYKLCLNVLGRLAGYKNSAYADVARKASLFVSQATEKFFPSLHK